MPKTIYTPRDELVCGKLDEAERIAIDLGSISLMSLLNDIRYDCERMEQKLISRKEEVERLNQRVNQQPRTEQIWRPE